MNNHIQYPQYRTNNPHFQFAHIQAQNFAVRHFSLIFGMCSNKFLTERLCIFRDITKYSTNVLNTMRFIESLLGHYKQVKP